ncbi:MAG TPA: pyrroline-5-carboxylate reductase dimerization domain-containing protein [Solirubrobacteraceae bacterium]|jgi:pyrroline-5-carboxylate reductase|nr:pyrroline-5-carboxylate reductase dimerization domain-containing protein [Solirubrobacteraceae bacterium]
MQVGLIGSGNMARALARGWGDPVLCSDAGSGRAAALVEELGGEALASNLAVAERADLVVLCHKPAGLKRVAQEIGGAAKAVASVLGATPTGMLQSAYPRTPVFRMMPNTAVEVRRGVVCYTPAAGVDAVLEAKVVALFARLGTVVNLDESQMEAASAVMGVGPAYQALLAEAQVDAAVRRGLKPRLAAELVVETMSGTAALLTARDFDTLAVRREVTSPGGSTARGLAALERAGVRTAFQDAIDAVIGLPAENSVPRVGARP